ncbi:PD-(D/E)XK nuclease-like domain-containing protein [Pimelobacter simplex]|uniref:PD-(D/E)XK nuclease-like domain-containing protein n=1 Tax=Nocardioides simplex TaxID=2045 RepID=UPI003AAFEC08
MSIIRDLPEADYHRDTEHLSASGAKVLLGKRPPSEDSDAIQFGRLVHTVILEPEKLDRYAVLNADVIGVKKDGSKATNPKNTDAWREAVFKAERDGLIVIDGRTLAKAQALADAVANHPEAGRLLAAATEHEVSMFADNLTGAPVRGRLDLLGPDFVADVKTCRDADPAEFGRVIEKLMYHVSAANYLDIARANGINAREFLFICVETEPTLSGEYRVSVIELHRDAIDLGRDLMAQACERWLANGRRIDLPHYGNGRHVVDLPPWAYDNDFEDIQIGGAA